MRTTPRTTIKLSDLISHPPLDAPATWIADRLVAHPKGSLSLRLIVGLYSIPYHDINPQRMHLELLNAGIQCFEDDNGKTRYRAAYILLY